MDWLYPVLLLGVAAFCLVQAIRDYRRKHYVWAVLSLACTALLLLMPFPTHSVAVDLPRP